MKTQTIEIDDDTATVLRQRAEERGVTVPELVAELATLAAGPVDADAADIAELDRRWKAFVGQRSVATNDEAVWWLQTWGTPAFGKYRQMVLQVLGAAYVFQYLFDGQRLVMLRVYHAREARE